MSSYIRFQLGDVHWQVLSDHADDLLTPQGLPLEQWLAAGHATAIKHGPHRSVYRVQLANRTIYLKHYRAPDLRALVSQWVQGARARREWNRAQTAASRAIPTIVPLALGEQRLAGLVRENFLITEGINEAEPLDRFVLQVLPTLSEQQQSRLRRRIAYGLGEIIARLHESGMVHGDLHAGNCLVQVHDSDKVSLYLIDMHAVAARRWASWGRCRANLLALGRFFLDVARPVDRLRFLRRYLELRPQLGNDWRRYSQRLYQAQLGSARRFWRRRDYRCVSNNWRFHYRSIGSAHGYAVTELGESALSALLRDPDSLFAVPGAEMLKSSGSSTVTRLIIRLGGVHVSAVYKRFNCPKWLDPIRATLHHSPALRAWHCGHGLLNRSIPTPRPLAILERTFGPLVRENYLLTEVAPGAMDLSQYLRQVFPQQPTRQRRRQIRQLAADLGRLLHKMHERNISHRDMKAVNVLVVPPATPHDPLRLQLIDLAGVQIWRRLPNFRRHQNLARITVSLRRQADITQADLLRCLRAYLPGGLRNRSVWKSLWRKTQRRAARKIWQNQLLRRPIT